MSDQNGPNEGPGWWTPSQSWKSQSSVSGRPSESGKNVSVTTINVLPAHEVHDGLFLFLTNFYLTF